MATAMTTFRYPKKLNRAGDSMEAYVKFTSFERKTRLASFPKMTVFLFMPERLTNPNTVEWSAEKLGPLAGQVERMVRSGNSSMSEAAGIVAGSAAAGWGNKAFSMGASIAQKLTGGNYDSSGLLGSMMGMIENPYITMLFRGVNLRTFEFLFKLYPHSKEETTEIHNIITEFRKASLPPGGGTEFVSGAFMGYPDEFEIEYMFEGKTNKYLNKFKRSVLIGIDTNYTASGMWSMTRDGFPAEIELTLRFQELEVVLRNDVDEGY